MINNHVSKLVVTDYFFNLNNAEATVASIYSDVLNTENAAAVLVGKPTRKYAQGFGYDDSHIIQLATITLAKGEKELGLAGILDLP
jgi:hypothetical protein